jgi:hypothetical protein
MEKDSLGSQPLSPTQERKENRALVKCLPDLLYHSMVLFPLPKGTEIRHSFFSFPLAFAECPLK